jgi:glycerol-3-phosphate dehydrogenase (NAD(P)+)
MNVTVIGSGAFGFSIALMLNKNGNKVTVWCSSEDKVQKIRENKIEIIPGIKIPKEIKFTASYEEAVKNAKIIYLIPSAKYIADVCQGIKMFAPSSAVYVIGSKGIEQGSCEFVHEVFKKNIKTKNYAVISGPSFAIDVANNEPIGFSLAAHNKKTEKLVIKSLASDTIKLRPSKDMIGTELCGSIKNVIAVAAGILNGLGYNESTRAFLIVESMHDIKELIKGLGGKKKTILSFAGIGDLLLTCTSTKSRNYSYGVLLGKKDFVAAKEYLDNNTVDCGDSYVINL